MRSNSDFPKHWSSPSRRFAAIALAALWLSAALPPPLSAAEPKPSREVRKKADEIAARAEAAYKNRAFALAAQLFIEAYQTDRTGVDWVSSAAQSYEEAGMLDEAAMHYAAFIAAPGANAGRVKKARLRAEDVDRLRRAQNGPEHGRDSAERWRQNQVDAAIALGKGRFRANRDGTVTQTDAGLVWQQGDSRMDLAWSDAKRYCANLSLASGSWRMPSIGELVRLIDKSRPEDKRLDAAFTNSSLSLWSASPYSGSTSSAWSVAFGYGNSNINERSVSIHVRCVRSAAVPPVAKAEPDSQQPATGNPGPYRIDASAKAVLDTRTQLTWQRATDGKDYNWKQAKSYCARLKLAAGGWRLPSKEELEGIVEKDKRPSIDGIAFPNTPTEYFWTSMAYQASASYAWAVDFSYGSSGNNDITYVQRVRCVR